MLFKLLVLILVLVVVYYIFFSKSSKKKRKANSEKRKKEINSENMIACAKCGVYVSTKEAIIKDGKYYCSNECANSN